MDTLSHQADFADPLHVARKPHMHDFLYDRSQHMRKYAYKIFNVKN